MANVIALDVYQIGQIPTRQGDTLSLSIDFPCQGLFAQQTDITVSAT